MCIFSKTCVLQTKCNIFMVNIHNLHYKYKKKPIFESLSVTFERGKIYGLLGKNGTGKSTLFKNICGLLKPKIGSVEVLGYSTQDRKPDMLSKIFMLPEDFFVPSVKINDFVSTLSPFYPKFSKEEFDTFLNDFEIPIDSQLDEMSMGQKKKALIAFSLATNTELLLMDEPTNGLDIVSKSQFKKVMANMASKDKCIIISTHQVKDIENLVDQIAIIDEGNILFNVPLNEVSKKLSFGYSLVNSPKEQVIYSEDSLNGIHEVLYNQTGEESKIDLELLYKAIMQTPSTLKDLFNHE